METFRLSQVSLGLLIQLGCMPGGSETAILERFERSACLPYTIRDGGKVWNETVALPDGPRLTVQATAAPSMSVIVVDEVTHARIVAADPADFVYPTDIRVDAGSARLYSRADGLRLGAFKQTWLFEYDLRGMEILTRRRIMHPESLPPKCSLIAKP